MKRITLWLLPPALLAGAAAYMLMGGRPREVSTAPARIGEAVELVYATGFVEPEHPVSVVARLTAPVRQVLVDEGYRVRRGQPLILLDDEEQRHALQQAGAQRRVAMQDAARVIALFAWGWVTRAARDQAVAAADGARAAEDSAAARLDQMAVRSGMDGMVLRRDVEPGDLAVPSRTLMTLGDPARIRITATIDERDVPRIRPGQPALMSSNAWPGRVLRGHVRDVTPGGDPEQRAFRARIVTDTPMAMPLGLTLEVNIVTRRALQALLIPATAVSDGRVWVVRDGRVHERAVRTGIAGPSDTQILSGLRRGETVVARPDDGLRENGRVRTRR
ncbi:efflux transporter periplasmic adaptor subunit [Sphingobium sp. 22B]|uniref:efflux RND transporter periplasmic adaptor subunit n=1 Tax=unclassified Sphingobium TaxID=2611147 RepID=UPI0007810808|nr:MULTISPECIES: efflux RND transporter periplasmic adaptor subunit [unclassified Sphingobium]KXU29428.1 efflux transporter periplasmic adaptor subunit [Sphingobium sp. AM]KYC30855.1 efflux transporter periplasmic adaptor subunit [Sphingobium sp. 22B]OAP29388.1 efflux transporter periplasmic adaptor subunit [Sphingobium sp. 20006FA]